jgi:hypothetical protein
VNRYHCSNLVIDTEHSNHHCHVMAKGAPDRYRVRLSKTRQKRRGRPATGRDAVTAIRLSKELRETIDKWAAQQDYPPGRSEAIRRLVELGLKAKLK